MDETIQPTQTSSGSRAETSKLLEEADYHRAEASSHLSTVKELFADLKAQRPDGNLTNEDIAELKVLLAEAEDYAAEADQLDRQREAIAAGEVVTKAVTVDAASNTVLTPSEAARVAQDGPDSAPASAGGRAS